MGISLWVVSLTDRSKPGSNTCSWVPLCYFSACSPFTHMLFTCADRSRGEWDTTLRSRWHYSASESGTGVAQDYCWAPNLDPYSLFWCMCCYKFEFSPSFHLLLSLKTRICSWISSQAGCVVWEPRIVSKGKIHVSDCFSPVYPSGEREGSRLCEEFIIPATPWDEDLAFQPQLVLCKVKYNQHLGLGLLWWTESRDTWRIF